MITPITVDAKNSLNTRDFFKEYKARAKKNTTSLFVVRLYAGILTSLYNKSCSLESFSVLGCRY